MTNRIAGIALTYGQAAGDTLVLDEPVSFWGGVDHLGMVADVYHAQHGAMVTGRVLLMTGGRGSSSGSFCLAELMRTHLAPAAIVMCEADGIVCTGVLVGQETYGYQLPVVQLRPEDYAQIPDGVAVNVSSTPDGATLTW